MSDLHDFLTARGAYLWRSGVLEYAEDFEREWRLTLRDPEGRAALTYAYQQAQQDGRDRGGLRCCGTTSGLHRPWCETGPRRYRAEERWTATAEGAGHDDSPRS